MFRKEKMKGNGNGKQKDNFFGQNSHSHFNNEYSNLYDVGSSSMSPPFDPSQFSTQKALFLDHQYVGPTVSDDYLYRWSHINNNNNGVGGGVGVGVGGNGVSMDELSLAREFERLGMGNDVVLSDHGRFGRDPNRVLGDCNNAVNFGFSDGFGRVSPSLYKDDWNCKPLGERVSAFGDSMGSVSPYGGGVGHLNGMRNYPLNETIHQQEEYYGHRVPVVRGNKMYDDRMPLYDSSDYLGNGGKNSGVNGSFGHGGYVNEIPVHCRSMYGAPSVDDSLQQYLMDGYNGMLNSNWAGSQNYGALLENYRGGGLGKMGGLNSFGSSRLQLLNSKETLSRRNVLYNAMREKMRASELRDSPPSLALLKKMRQPSGGLNGSNGHNNHSSSRRKTLISRSFDLNGGISSPVGSCDSSDLQTIYSSLGEVQGNIYQMAKDQNGCRFLQKKFEDGSYEDVQTIFDEIIDHVVDLMVNPFGNYLIQRLLGVCNEEQRIKIVHVVTKDQGELVRICLNSHGTRVVQKLIDSLKTREEISLIMQALEPGFLDLVQDLNGNHVIQRCLQCLNCDDNKFIFDGAAKFCVEIATHRHGCCVMQHCIAHSNGGHREKLIEEICNNGLILAQDPFGNYVVQYIIELKIPSAAARLVSQFEGRYVQLSMQKFSSHVVEKCLKYIEQSQTRIVYELLSVARFEQLLQDPFANYVVQSALEVTKGALNESLAAAVRPHSILRTNPYCKKIFTRGLINN